MMSSRCYGASAKCAESADVQNMASGDKITVPKDEDRPSEEPPSSVEPKELPGYLPWERDLEMISRFLDRKVRTVCSVTHA